MVLANLPDWDVAVLCPPIDPQAAAVVDDAGVAIVSGHAEGAYSLHPTEYAGNE